MKCPKCHEELERTELNECGVTAIDVCPACEGAWFDKGELDGLDDSVFTNAEELEFQPAQLGEARYSCPRCADSLESVSPAEDKHLVVDRCPRCEGFWLDPGELETLRGISLEKDDARLDSVKPIQKPRDWSWLRWAAYWVKASFSSR